MNSFALLDMPYTTKTRLLGLSVGKDFVILAYVILTKYQL